VTPGVIIYQLEDNIDDIEPLLDPISTTTVKSIELMLKLMASASSITMAEQIVRQHMKNFPPEVLEKIIFGAAAGVIAGVATSFSGVGTPTGITAIIACTIIVDIAFEQLNNSTDGNS